MRLLRTTLLLILMLVACRPAQNVEITPTASPIQSEGRVLVLGDISDDPAEVIEGTQLLADYLADRLVNYGITAGKVQVASSMEEMIALLKNGQVDLYFDSTYPATLISDASGAKIILRRWRFGVETYHSVIFASKASGITRIEDLPGHIVAMDAPYSTSGFLLPAVHLLEHGLQLSGKKTYNDPVAANEVGFVFSYDDDNTLQWILSGLVDAGVTDDYHFDKAFPRDAVETLVLLARTENTPRQVVLARAELEENLLEAIKAILIDMDTTPEGQAALKPFQTTQFDEFPEGTEKALQRMRAMADKVKSIPLP